VFDVATGIGTSGPYPEPAWDFDSVDRGIGEAMNFAPLQTMEGVKRYFEWAGFVGYDLCLHVVEEQSEVTIREFFVDFRTLDFPDAAPGGLPLIRMKVHADSFRYVLMHGLSWDDIYIGFQARFFVEPDIYHMKFWNHFARLENRDPIRWVATEPTE
jgi:CMP-N-acetylneuraminate monooxygenase